jgi:glyoxylase-like metal-dependent hydrolase (beta-lactamase superfamily II)
VSEWQITPLVDAEGSFASYAEAFPGLAGERLDAERRVWPDLFRDGDWWLPFRAFLLTGPTVAVVDAAVGVGAAGTAFLPGRQGRLPGELARAGVDPADVELVFLTHLHVDHVGWVDVFDRARYVCGAPDWAHFASRSYLRDVLEARRARFELLHSENEVAPGLVAVPTPGHTPGHMCLRVGETAVVLGDICVHPAQLTDPGLVYTADVDGALAAQTRRATLEWLADERLLVAASHLPGALGHVERMGAGFVWRPSG